MRKIFGYVCDYCSVFRTYGEEKFNPYIKVIGKKRELHYCSKDCKVKHNGKRQNRKSS